MQKQRQDISSLIKSYKHFEKYKKIIFMSQSTALFSFKRKFKVSDQLVSFDFVKQTEIPIRLESQIDEVFHEEQNTFWVKIQPSEAELADRVATLIKIKCGGFLRTKKQLYYFPYEKLRPIQNIISMQTVLPQQPKQESLLIQTKSEFYILNLSNNTVILLKEKIKPMSIFYDSMVTYVTFVELINEILVVVVGEITENELHETLKFSINEEEVDSISLLSR